MKLYLKLILAFITFGLIVVSTASYWLDPYGIYSSENDLFPRKVAAANKGRTVKPYQALNVTPFTVLVGNSRIELGMPKQHSFYQDKPVYNMGLPGAGISMQYDYALHAINNSGTVGQVVIALDFLDFTSRANNITTTANTKNWSWRLVNVDRVKSFKDKRKYYAERLSLLFSLSTIIDSIKTVITQHNNVNALNRFGFNDGNLYHFHVAAESFGALYQQKAAELDERLSKQKLIFDKNSYYPYELDSFIKLLKQKNINIYLIINPYQQPYLDKISQYQLDEHLKEWKQEMALVATRNGLSLFDFAISSNLVTDVVAPTSKKAEDSPYFWEPAHYRPAFGELILDTLLTTSCDKICLLTKFPRIKKDDHRTSSH